MKKVICIVILVTVLALSAGGSAESGVGRYVGAWHGGPRYPNGASEYTMTISRLPNGEYALEFEVYRTVFLEGSVVEYDSVGDEAIVSFGDGYYEQVVGILKFFSDSMRLDIVQSNVYDVSEDDYYWFE